MKVRSGALLVVGLLVSVASAQEQSRYWRAGRNNRTYYDGRYEGSVRGSYGNESRSTRVDGASRYEDRYGVHTDYEGRYQKAPVAQGRLSETGGGERTYLHDNDPAKIESIEKAESNRRRIEKDFVDFTRSTQESIAENELRRSQLKAEPYRDRKLQHRALESADWAVQSAKNQQELMRKLRQLQHEAFGTPR